MWRSGISGLEGRFGDWGLGRMAGDGIVRGVVN
jgi:hypothetical protein